MRKRCKICGAQFVPEPKVGIRQKTCGAEDCKLELTRRRQAAWRKSPENAGYSSDRYQATKKCPSRDPEYRKEYRKRDSVRAANAAYMRKYRTRKSIEAGRAVRCTNADITITPEKSGDISGIAVSGALIRVRRTNADMAINIELARVLGASSYSGWSVRCTKLDGSS